MSLVTSVQLGYHTAPTLGPQPQPQWKSKFTTAGCMVGPGSTQGVPHSPYKAWTDWTAAPMSKRQVRMHVLQQSQQGLSRILGGHE